MGSSPKIIELYGLPGCGKTTLCEKLINYFPQKIIDVESIWLNFREQSVIRQISAIPFKTLTKLLFLFLLSPKLSKKELNIYIGFFVHIMAYSYVRKTKYEYLISDNGLIQDVVSLFYKKESKFSRKHVTVICSLLKDFDNSTQIYCDIPVTLSLERIRKRNRNKGRLDLISENKKLLGALTIQSDFFRKVNDMLRFHKVDYCVLNMNADMLNVVSQVVNIFHF